MLQKERRSETEAHINGGLESMNENNIVLIPAYEPGETLDALLEELSVTGCRIIVVDDGSGPDFSEVFERAAKKATVLTHKENRGKGAALKTGFAYISQHCEQDSVIVTVDSDGQHSVTDSMRLCELARKHPDTLILGCRKMKGNVPIRSWFGNTVTRMIFRLATGQSIYDTQTGLRAFHRDLLPTMMKISGERYEYEMNMLLEFAREGRPMLEEEIETIYLNNNAASHFDTVKDSVRVYKEILKFSASGFASFLTDYSLYSLLLALTGNLRVSNIGARVVSSCVNFTLNRKYVFKSRSNVLKSAISYFLLAAAILAGNTLVLEFLVNTAGMNRLIAKMLTELTFLVVSWTVQRFVIFKKGDADGEKATRFMRKAA